MKYHSTYKGIAIYRNSAGYGLPWTAIAPNLTADTLIGLKKLIRNLKITND